MSIFRNRNLFGAIPLLKKIGQKTWTPTTTNQIIKGGSQLEGDQTILGDADLIAGNIKLGVDIFGVTGTLAGGPTMSSLQTLTSGDLTMKYWIFGKLYIISTINGVGGTALGEAGFDRTKNRLSSDLGVTVNTLYYADNFNGINSYVYSGPSSWLTATGAITPIRAFLID